MLGFAFVLKAKLIVEASKTKQTQKEKDLSIPPDNGDVAYCLVALLGNLADIAHDTS